MLKNQSQNSIDKLQDLFNLICMFNNIQVFFKLVRLQLILKDIGFKTCTVIQISDNNKTQGMSKQSIKVTIEICSNCKSHAWCTRHNQANYLALAQQILKSINAQDSKIQIQVLPVGGTKMGSFEVICQGHLLFSKLSLGYFPHVTAVTKRVLSFIEDYKNGNDLTKYQPGVGSPVRSNSNFNRTSSAGFQKSPIRRQLKIAYNQQNPKQEQKQSPKKAPQKQFKVQENNFVLHQKKSEKKIERSQVIIPESQKSKNKIQSSKKVEQSKLSQQFIIDKKDQQHHQSKKQLKVENPSNIKPQENNDSQQFILDDKTKQQATNEPAKDETPQNAQDNTNQQPQQGRNHQKNEKQLATEVITEIFNQYDKDRSGNLSKKEVKKLLQFILEAQGRKGLKISEQAVRKWISDADSDGDGIISLQQLIDFFLANNSDIE